MSIMILLLLLFVGSFVPLLLCVWLARVDARQHRRAMALRTLTVSTALTAAIASAIVVLTLYMMRAAPPNVSFGVNWIAIGIVFLFLFLWSTAAGAIGYSIGTRLFANAIPEGNYGGDEPVQRVDESGNPYQPPST